MPEPNLERDILGCVLLQPSLSRRLLSVFTPTDFSDPAYRKIFTAIRSTVDDNLTPDYTILYERLRQEPDARELSLVIGGLNEGIYTTTGFDSYVRLLVERNATSELSAVGDKVKRMLQEGESAEDVVGALRGLLGAVSSRLAGGRTVPLGEGVSDTVDAIQELREGKATRLKKFYLRDIDKMMGGMLDGELVVVAGLEKSGKTTLLLQILQENAKRGVASLLFSQEMTLQQLHIRFATITSKTSWVKILNCDMRDDDWGRMKDELYRLKDLPIYVNDRMNNIDTIIAESRNFKEAKGVGLIGVDYVQIVGARPGGRKNESREREVATISAGLKGVAKENNVPVIALSQLNEEFRARESRAIEQDMDKMITIKGVDQEMPWGKAMDLSVRQRLGLSGDGAVKMYYLNEGGVWGAANYHDEIPVGV